MRARSFNFFRPYLIWLTGSVSKCRGRRSCRGCSYHLYYSSSLSSGLNHASSSPSAKAILSAMIREVFVVYIDLAGTALLRLAESAGSDGRWLKEESYQSSAIQFGTDAPRPVIHPNSRGLQLKLTR